MGKAFNDMSDAAKIRTMQCTIDALEHKIANSDAEALRAEIKALNRTVNGLQATNSRLTTALDLAERTAARRLEIMGRLRVIVNELAPDQYDRDGMPSKPSEPFHIPSN